MKKNKTIEELGWPVFTGRPVIGIDPSLNGTAISIYQPTEKNVFLLSHKKDASELEKLAYIHRFFSVAPAADYFIEGMSLGSKHFHSSSAMVQGIIRANIAATGKATVSLIPPSVLRESTINLVPPSTLKLFTVGNGHAKKEDMKLWIYKLWGEEFRTNDETDAYALMMMGRYYLGHKGLPELNQKRKECLTKITKYV